MPDLVKQLKFHQVYPPESRFLKRLRQRLRFHFSSLYCYREVSLLLQFIQQKPHWKMLFEDMPFRYNAIFHKFCDKRFNKNERFNAILDNFTLSEQYFGYEFCLRLLTEKRIELFCVDDVVLSISLNDIEPAEGYFALGLHCGGERVYNASFTFLAPNKLLIASIQGSNNENAQELIKQSTKKLHGIRPMFMLIELLKMLASHYQLKLYGIAHKHQAKYRFNDNTRLLFNYNDFWQENGATLNAEGYWQLSNQSERKALEDIQSKKRSMYRKRYDMLDTLAIQLVQRLKG